jgi:hypothetical protein
LNASPIHSKEKVMPRWYLFAFILIVALALVPGCQTVQPTPLPPSVAPEPTAFPPTVTLLPTITLEPSSTPLPSAALTPTLTLLLKTPTVPPPPACQNPNVTITSPAMNSQVSDIIEVHGTATHPLMAYWKVEYRTDGSLNYAMLSNGDAPVMNGVLARLSTKTLPNGVYWLRLSVVQKDGNYQVPCEIRITLTNP